MIEIRQTEQFSAWLKRLRDPIAKQKIAVRVQRLAFGNPGDVKPIGAGLSELRIQYGPGYRVYFVRRGQTLIVLLCGGDKGTQGRDVTRAKELAEQIED